MLFKLAQYYTSGMIFQRERPIYIEGEAFEAGKITAVLDYDRAEAEVQPGRFSLELPARPAGQGHRLVVFGGGQTEIFHDIYIGEVWVAGGQSNMEWTLQQSDEYRQHPFIRQNSDIRLYTVARNNFPYAEDYGAGYEWAHGRDSGWAGCGESNAPHFSAAAYFFAHRLYETLGIPIGIINCNVGGSSIFSWIPKEAILENEEIAFVWKEYEQLLASHNADEELARYHRALDEHAHYAKNQPNIVATQWGRWFFNMQKYGAYHYHRPGGLYAAMLDKIARFPTRGMIWYQGETESNPHKGPHYAAALDALVGNLAKQQSNPGYDFNFVQLAPWDCPGNDSWAAVCDQMRIFAVRNPRFGMVTIGDCGGGTDIHPPRKQPVGERLALAALNNSYGVKREYTGPLATEAILCTDTNGAEAVKITFTHAAQLEKRGYEYEPHGLGRFEFVYADGSKKPANAAYIENTKKPPSPPCIIVPIVRADNGNPPTAIQYEYFCEPKVALCNQVGLPASLFRLEIPTK
jgi:sialate O-acetylesterase